MPPCTSEIQVTKIDEKTPIEHVLQEQYLAPEPEEMAYLTKYAQKNAFRAKVVWRNVAIFAALHFGALIGLYQLIFLAKWPTVVWTFVCYFMSGLGITAGAHRLWSHRSYKANSALEFILLCFNTMAFQNDVIEWSRDHRCHHKWTDTDADPHNTNRGIFFSHMGWLMMRKHPKISEMGAKLDLSDLTSNRLLAFQRRHYLLLVLLVCFLIPTCVPVYFWGERPLVAFYTAAVFRYCFTLHMTWLINSAAHAFGYRPYDVNITPRENFWTTVGAFGEGGHNYHHTFPQDYRTSEMPYLFNWTRFVIDSFAKIGWAYDLNEVDDRTVERQKQKQIETLKTK